MNYIILTSVAIAAKLHSHFHPKCQSHIIVFVINWICAPINGEFCRHRSRSAVNSKLRYPRCQMTLISIMIGGKNRLAALPQAATIYKLSQSAVNNILFIGAFVLYRCMKSDLHSQIMSTSMIDCNFQISLPQAQDYFDHNRWYR